MMGVNTFTNDYGNPCSFKISVYPNGMTEYKNGLFHEWIYCPEEHAPFGLVENADNGELFYVHYKRIKFNYDEE